MGALKNQARAIRFTIGVRSSRCSSSLLYYTQHFRLAHKIGVAALTQIIEVGPLYPIADILRARSAPRTSRRYNPLDLKQVRVMQEMNERLSIIWIAAQIRADEKAKCLKLELLV
jgi:hypothetical protein